MFNFEGNKNCTHRYTRPQVNSFDDDNRARMGQAFQDTYDGRSLVHLHPRNIAIHHGRWMICDLAYPFQEILVQE